MKETAKISGIHCEERFENLIQGQKTLSNLLDELEYIDDSLFTSPLCSKRNF